MYNYSSDKRVTGLTGADKFKLFFPLKHVIYVSFPHLFSQLMQKTCFLYV